MENMKNNNEASTLHSLITEKSKSVVERIIQRMRQQKDFPTFYQNFIEINKAIKSNYASASEVANVILKDYALTKKLLTLVNSAFYGHNKSGVTTVSEAVVLVGINQVQMAIASLMFFEQMQQNSHTVELKDSSIHAFISGLIARELSKKWQQKETEEACICAMLHNLGKYMALFYLPDQYKEVVEYAAQKNTELQPAARAVLGVSYEDLGIGIAEAWGLPGKITRSMKSLTGGPNEKVKNNPMRAIAHISNMLCDTAIEADTNKREKLLKLLESRFNLSEDVVSEVFINVWEKLSKYSKILNINLKDSKILINYAANFIIQDKINLKDTESVVITNEFHDIVTKGIANITRILLEDAYELNSILSMILEIMYLGFGFSHVLICIVDFKANRMNARYGLGDNIDKFMNHFSFEIATSNDFLNVALHQEKPIYIKNINNLPEDMTLPDWYHKIARVMDAMVYPILINGKKIGLFYADRQEKRIDYSESQLEYMNILCNQAALAIKQKGR